MARKNAPRRETNETARFRCGGGLGIVREEVWVDDSGKVVRCNLAFVLPHVQHADHGRVLGYDNVHGPPERHWMGNVERVAEQSYERIRRRFIREAGELRRQYENGNFS